MNKEHLTACPFCGGEPVHFRGNIIGKIMVAIRCKDCGTIGPQFFDETKDSHTLATTLWNERSKDKRFIEECN